MIKNLPPRRLTIGLTYFGALPFILLVVPDLPLIDLVGDRTHAFRAYGAVIAAFMAGSIWGLCQRQDEPPVGPVVSSNILALAACASLLLTSADVSAALIIQLITFWCLLLVDDSLRKAGLEPHWYFRLRLGVTSLVTLAYIAALTIF